MRIFRGEREAKKGTKTSDEDLHIADGCISPGKGYTRVENGAYYKTKG